MQDFLSIYRCWIVTTAINSTFDSPYEVLLLGLFPSVMYAEEYLFVFFFP